MDKKIGTLIKTFKGKRVTEAGINYDTLLLFYRDENGEKQTIFYDRPEVEYYTIKDKNSEEASHPPLNIEMSKLEKHITYSDNLMRDIAVVTGTLPFYDKIRFNYGVNSYNMKNLFKSPLLYDADFNLEDQYISKFYKEYEPNKNYRLHKSYFDIENDIYHYIGFPDPTEAPCPVCVLTLIDESSKMSYTFILRNKENHLLSDFENDIDNFKSYMTEKIKETDELDLTFNFYFFDEEIDLIKSFFKKVHEIDPDYCSGWNIEYDIQTLQNRLNKLYENKKNRESGLSPKVLTANAICDDKYLIQKNKNGEDTYITPQAYYNIGNGKIGFRTDNFIVLDGINWLDQMLAYATMHISSGKSDSYKLDDVSTIELGKEKLPYEPGETIRNLLYKNPRKFVEYNIRDVLLLLLLEDKTKDIDSVQRLSDITVTRNDKCFKKSIALTNFINKYAEENDLALATNKSATYGVESAYYENNYVNSSKLLEYDNKYLGLFKKKDKYGAFVSDPNNNDFVGYEIFKGKKSQFLFEDVCDEDFSSLYPSIIQAFNLDSTNIIGKFYLIDSNIKSLLKNKYKCGDMFKLSIKDKDVQEIEEIEDDDNDDENIIDSSTDSQETDDISSVLTDALISKNWILIGSVFMNLPSTSELIDKIEKKRSL